MSERKKNLLIALFSLLKIFSLTLLQSQNLSGVLLGVICVEMACSRWEGSRCSIWCPSYGEAIHRWCQSSPLSQTRTFPSWISTQVVCSSAKVEVILVHYPTRKLLFGLWLTKNGSSSSSVALSTLFYQLLFLNVTYQKCYISKQAFISCTPLPLLSRPIWYFLLPIFSSDLSEGLS